MLVKEARRVIIGLIVDVANHVPLDGGLLAGLHMAGLFLHVDEEMTGRGESYYLHDPDRRVSALRLVVRNSYKLDAHRENALSTYVYELRSHLTQLLTAIDVTGDVPKEWEKKL